MTALRRATRVLPLLAAACLATPAAHAVLPEGDPPTLATAWTLSPWALAPLLLLTALYAAGVQRLWRRAGRGRGVSGIEVGAFAAALAALVLAMVWPLDALGEYALSAHMAQHMLLLALAPPLLLAARPFAVAATALPQPLAQALHRGLHRPMAALTRALAPATVAHAAVMLLWQLPGATTAALASEPLHWAMHASFLLAGLWFWAAVRQRLRAPDAGATGGLVALVSVMMLMGFLGALLTFAPRLLYPVYSNRALLVGMDPLVDQQLAGLVMWVPAALPYLVVGMWLVVALLRRGARRAPAARPAARGGDA
ncbi:cytochrome c oxidase assembly protein [Luteimonas sp. BDR2-5]|uniref:cytochrome c oxidase assembly protein n=1 Tax=Proluteimonas luteida TaxID=2878685 RepID=UPI001E385667|nr:cytochrome c oxidase assembly protein [Luteimonas sp. BDR2-5]MCD9028835.1 cytochrome c oxidase assembly protein [Luteimonas sp. BDR2-5]